MISAVFASLVARSNAASIITAFTGFQFEIQMQTTVMDMSKVAGISHIPSAITGSVYSAVGMKKDAAGNYAVYDEVHSLDGDEGDALQRLMTGVSCPFLALSATIGNGEALRSWCQKLRNAHSDAAPAGDGPDDPRHCNLVEHEGRFINLQRYVWDDAGAITPLHPCAAMTVESLAGGVT